MTVPDVMTVRSTAFAEGEGIPPRFTCDGDGVEPPLVWEGVPPGASALALVVDDPDAPRATFTHCRGLSLNCRPVGPCPSPNRCSANSKTTSWRR